MLLGQTRQRNPELTGFSIEIWTLNPQRLGGVGHPPPMVLEDGGDVLALESEPGFPQVPGRRERRRGSIQTERRQQVLDLNNFIRRLADHALDDAVELGEIAGPRER